MAARHRDGIPGTSSAGGATHPRARTARLILTEVPDELLIYDLDTHRAHCLNRTAALVWKLCDGTRDVGGLARDLGAELGSPVVEDLVWHTLADLDRHDLMREPSPLPASLAGTSRRDFLRHAALATAVAAPLIASIVAPTAAEAGSCKATGQPCSSNGECCSSNCSGSVCT